MENDKNSGSQYFAYARYMALMMIILVAVNVGVYLRNFYAGLLMSCGLVVYLIVLLVYYNVKKKKAAFELVNFAAAYDSLQTKIIRDFSFPYLIIDKNADVIWSNAKFHELMGEDYKTERVSLTELFPDFKESFIPKKEKSEFFIDFDNKRFRVVMRFLTDDNALEIFDFPNISPADLSHLYAMAMFDETLLYEYKQKYENEAMVPAILYVDNYEETLESIEEVRRSIVQAMLDRKLTAYFNNIDAIIRKYERDKYYVMMRMEKLNEERDKHFPILSEVKEINLGEDLKATVSIGFGINQGSYIKNMEAARTSITLALGRGGDQIVVKDGESIKYFGGKTMAVEKNTKVKSRVKARALHDIMSESENVVIMGHKLIDMDAIGAAIGIYRAAKTIGKKAYIVVDSVSTSIKPLIDIFVENPEYESDFFITCEKAKEITTAMTALVIVDTCNPDYVVCPELLDKTRRIVVLDHHRRGSTVIPVMMLSYIEPSASSTCEMVVELVQYFDETLKLKTLEADALYAGIVVDTDNFMQKTGVRTFEAATYLKRGGANTVRVRKILRGSMAATKAKGEIMSSAELFREHYAISVCRDKTLKSPTIIASQAANEMLDIMNVRASFVLAEYNDQIYISARSIDEVNVQLIMERMGGGGHINIAGAQLTDVTIDEAMEKLKSVLSYMIDEGDI